ncbi:MAG: ADP-ribosylation factor-like protein [Candidatus Helarchaeota archaeon]
MVELKETVEEMACVTSQEALHQKILSLLDAVKIPETLKDVPNLAIHDFRDLSVNEAELIEELLKVKTIRDLSKVSYNQLMNRIALITEIMPKEKLELLITAAKYIVKAADYKPIEAQKVVLAGLDNAGKTALLNTIKKEVGFSEISSLKPTKGANRDDLFLADQEILIVELGGQDEFRKFYIDQPDRFFLDTDIIVYLIDIIDDGRFQESIEYLGQILRTLKYLQEQTDFVIIFSKCDPDIINSPMFQERYDYLENKVVETFKPYIFKFEIQTSSIYNIVSMTPSFSRMLKGIFSGSALAEEEKIASIGKLLMKVVDLFLDTDTHLNNALNKINKRLNNLEQMVKDATRRGGKVAIVSDTGPKPQKKPDVTALEPSKPKPSGPRGGLSARAALLSELKQVFGVKFGGKKT